MTNQPHKPQRTVIVGGVAGGMSTAARLRRMDEKMEIIVLESSGHVSFANCGLPYYLGQVIEDREALLLQTPESLRARFNLDVRVNTTAVAIDRKLRPFASKAPASHPAMGPTPISQATSATMHRQEPNALSTHWNMTT